MAKGACVSERVWKICAVAGLAALVLGLVPPDQTRAQTGTAAPGRALTAEALDFQMGRNGKPKDEARARALFQTAAGQGDAQAMYWLGEYHREGRGGLARSDAAALDWYRRGDAAGDGRASARLGEFHATGRGGAARSPEQAETLFARAEARGAPALASIQSVIDVVEKSDPMEAVRWYALGIEMASRMGPNTLGARRGDAMINAVATLLLQPAMLDRQTPHDARLARGLRATLARDGDAAQTRAYLLLAVFHQLGRGGLRPNDAEAVRLYRVAANRDDPDAEFLLGRMEEDGRAGRQASRGEALARYRRAINSSQPMVLSSFAAYQLGIAYATGEGLPPNAAAARLWLRQAASDLPEARDLLVQLDALGGRGQAKCTLSGPRSAITIDGQRLDDRPTATVTLFSIGQSFIAHVSSDNAGVSIPLNYNGDTASGSQEAYHLGGEVRRYDLVIAEDGRARLVVSMARRPRASAGGQYDVQAVRYSYEASGTCANVTASW
jgi:TPR repeat protein